MPDTAPVLQTASAAQPAETTGFMSASAATVSECVSAAPTAVPPLL